MNVNDLAIVSIAAVTAAVFVAFFAWRCPVSVRAWALGRLLPGVAGIAGLTVVASLLLGRVAAADAGACEAMANTYDCEDAFLIVVMAILAGGLAAILFGFGSAGLYAVGRLRGAGVVA